jgi:hypothetical protein
MRKLQATGLFLGVILAASTARADDPATPRSPPARPRGPRVAGVPGLLALPQQGYGQPGYAPPGYARPGYAQPGYASPAQCAGGERVVSSESHFYSFPLFMAGLGGIVAAPLVGVSIGVPLHATHSGDTAFVASFTATVAVLAAGISLAVVGGHRVSREVYAVSALLRKPGPGGLAFRF